jgi:hypothetical protein
MDVTNWFFVPGVNGNLITVDDTAFRTSEPLPGELFISEISDAVSSQNRYIEIWNTTSRSLDLSTTKLINTTDGLIYNFDGGVLPSIVLAPNEFIIISNGATQGAFQAEFGTVNSQVRFIQGPSSILIAFSKEFSIRAGGTPTSTTDGTLITDTNGIRGGSGFREYLDFDTVTYVQTPSAEATPGVNDILVYESSAWKFNASPNINTGEADMFVRSNLDALEDIIIDNGDIAEGVILSMDTFDLTINGVLTFRSGPSLIGVGAPPEDAQLDIVGSNTITGTARVERYMNANRAYRLITPTVTTTSSIRDNWQEGVSNTGVNFPADQQNPNPGFGTHITGGVNPDGTANTANAIANGFDVTITTNPSMFTYDNSTGDYASVPNTNSEVLESGLPYTLMVRGSRSTDISIQTPPATPTRLRATGTLSIGTFTTGSGNLPALNTNTSSSNNPLDSGFQGAFSMVANPYQAIVGFSNLTITGGLNTNFVYVFGATFNLTPGLVGGSWFPIEIGGSPPLGFPEYYLQPGQGFMVVNQASGVTTPTITFEEVDKAVDQNPILDVFNEDEQPEIMLAQINLVNTNNMIVDFLKVRFMENAKNEFDDFDLFKLFNQNENIGTYIDQAIFSIQRRDMPQQNEVVPMFIDGYTDSAYELQLEKSFWDNNVEVYIVDNHLNTTTLVDEGQPYSFTVDASIPETMATDRFSLVFDNQTLGVADNSFGANFSLYPNPTKDGLFAITTPGLSGDVEVQLTNILGQEVSSRTLTVSGNEVNVDASSLSAGVYIVKLSQNDNTFTSKVIVE